MYSPTKGHSLLNLNQGEPSHKVSGKENVISVLHVSIHSATVYSGWHSKFMCSFQMWVLVQSESWTHEGWLSKRQTFSFLIIASIEENHRANPQAESQMDHGLYNFNKDHTWGFCLRAHTTPRLMLLDSACSCKDMWSWDNCSASLSLRLPNLTEK